MSFRRTVVVGVSACMAAGGLPLMTASKAQAAGCTVNQVLSRMSLEQRVGQLFMVGTPATGASSTVLQQISSYHVGNVFLSGRTTAGTSSVGAVTSALRSRVSGPSTSGVGLLIAADQEGGNVQALQGSGFTTMPTALAQGLWPSNTLQGWAKTWGGQLKSAGVNMNLAPVADTVPYSLNRGNPPIGYWYREYGYDSYRTAAGAGAFAAGMRSAGVMPTAKHFPGLGVVRANTDTTAWVHDRATTPNNAYLNPFFTATSRGAGFVMISSAIYDRIDPYRPAVFSWTVSRLLRDRGFDGPMITDDLGNAVAMSPYSVGNRAVSAINGGSSMILTVDAGKLPAMYAAVLARTKSSQQFANLVWTAAHRVLAAKASMGLLPQCKV